VEAHYAHDICQHLHTLLLPPAPEPLQVVCMPPKYQHIAHGGGDVAGAKGIFAVVQPTVAQQLSGFADDGIIHGRAVLLEAIVPILQ
jgi:hypothetical protein